jgi:hypothetical protein
MAKAQNAAKIWCLTIELDDFTVYKPIDETAAVASVHDARLNQRMQCRCYHVDSAPARMLRQRLPAATG